MATEVWCALPTSILQGFQSRFGWMHLASHECLPRAKNVGLVPAYSAMRKNDQRAKFVFSYSEIPVGLKHAK